MFMAKVETASLIAIWLETGNAACGISLLGKSYSVAHHYSPSVAHCWCATTITPLLSFSSGALLVRHNYPK
jgi:hypothetical protein